MRMRWSKALRVTRIAKVLLLQVLLLQMAGCERSQPSWPPPGPKQFLVTKPVDFEFPSMQVIRLDPNGHRVGVRYVHHGASDFFRAAWDELEIVTEHGRYYARDGSAWENGPLRINGRAYHFDSLPDDMLRASKYSGSCALIKIGVGISVVPWARQDGTPMWP